MKRLWITLTAMIAIKTFAAAANTQTLPVPGPTDSLISIPVLQGGWVLGISGYYLQPMPTSGDLDYLQINTNIGKKIKQVNPSYDTGWGANVGYIFPNTGNDANVSYYHLGTTDSNAVRGADFILFNPGAILNGPTTAHYQAEYTLNQVDVTAGQFINIGKEIVLHPNIGVRWAEVGRQTFGFITNTTTDEEEGTITSLINIQDFSNFHGLGPELGLDANYKIAYGLNFVGHFDTALLLGFINAHTTSKDLVNSIEVVNEFSENDLTRVVPMTDLKLGLNYIFIMDIPTDSTFTIEAGWQTSEIYNAVDRIYGSAIGEQGSVRDNKFSNIGLSGPYIKLVFRA